MDISLNQMDNMAVAISESILSVLQRVLRDKVCGVDDVANYCING